MLFYIVIVRDRAEISINLRARRFISFFFAFSDETLASGASPYTRFIFRTKCILISEYKALLIH